jgi:TonB family protein
MFDTLLASNTAPSLSSRPTIAASVLHLLLVAVAIDLTQAPSRVVPLISRDTVRLEIGPLPSPTRPHIVPLRTWMSAAPVAPPQLPEVPYMPTVDAAGLRPLHSAALLGIAFAEVPLRLEAAVFPSDNRALSPVEVDELPEVRGRLRPSYPERLRRAGITGEAKLEYVIAYTGRVDTGSVRVIATTDPTFAMSSIEAVLGASFKPALRAGRPVAVLVRQTIRFQDR